MKRILSKQLALVLIIVMLLSSVGISEEAVNVLIEGSKVEAETIETQFEGDDIVSSIVDEPVIEESNDVDLPIEDDYIERLDNTQDGSVDGSGESNSDTDLGSKESDSDVDLGSVESDSDANLGSESITTDPAREIDGDQAVETGPKETKNEETEEQGSEGGSAIASIEGEDSVDGQPGEDESNGNTAESDLVISPEPYDQIINEVNYIDLDYLNMVHTQGNENVSELESEEGTSSISLCPDQDAFFAESDGLYEGGTYGEYTYNGIIAACNKYGFYDDGAIRYWTYRVNTDSSTSYRASQYKRDGVTVYGFDFPNGFGQCWAFANLIGYELSGTIPNDNSVNWMKITSLEQLNNSGGIRVGDIIRSCGHSGVVLSVAADGDMRFVQCAGGEGNAVTINAKFRGHYIQNGQTVYMANLSTNRISDVIPFWGSDPNGRCGFVLRAYNNNGSGSGAISTYSGNTTSISKTYRIKSTTTLGLNIRPAASTSNTPLGTLSPGVTIVCTKRTNNQINGYYWLYGTTSTGITGWITENLDWIEEVSSSTTSSTSTSTSSQDIITIKAKSMRRKAKWSVGTKHQYDFGSYTIKSCKSSKNKVATISSTGIIETKAEGKTKITVRFTNNKIFTLKLTVIDRTKPKRIILNKKGIIKWYMQDPLTLTATLSPKTAVSDITWKTSNSRIATVSNGVLTFKKKGFVKITATTKKGKKKASVIIWVVSR